MKVAFVVLASLLSIAVASAQVRDAPAPPRALGTSSIAGRVLDDLKRPVRRAVVRLEGDGFFRSLITDTDGAFVFDELAAGRYRLSASKPAFVTGRYGAARPGR